MPVHTGFGEVRKRHQECSHNLQATSKDFSLNYACANLLTHHSICVKGSFRVRPFKFSSVGPFPDQKSWTLAVMPLSCVVYSDVKGESKPLWARMNSTSRTGVESPKVWDANW